MNTIESPTNLNLIGLSGRIGSGKDKVTEIIQYLTCTDKEIRKSFIESPVKTMELYDGIISFNTPYRNVKFSAKVKFIVAELLGVTVRKLEDKTYINTELNDNWWFYEVEGEKLAYLDKKFEDSRERLEEFLVKLTPRKLMQLVGTEAGRDIIHPDIWVNSTFSTYEPDEDGILPHWLISDVRFPNELNKVHDNGGFSIRLVRHKLLSDWLKMYTVEIEGYNDRMMSDVEFMDFMNDIKINEDIEEVIEKLNHASEVSLDGYNFHYVVDNDSTIVELVNRIYEILVLEGVLSKSGELIDTNKVKVD